MKKTLTILALAVGVTGAYAQDLTSKKGEQILPEAKDWAIGVDATPFLGYVGNFFGKSANNTAPTFNFLNSFNQTITGKYFTDASMAYRASLRIGLGSQTQREMVADRTVLSTPPTFPSTIAQKENEWKHSNTNIGLAVGIEKRRGKTRLQGYYGAEVGISFSSSKDKFTYGNALSADPINGIDVDAADSFTGAANVVPSSNVFEGTTGSSARVKERKNGASFGIGLRAFIGAEYFILPKISLGGEFGWGLGLVTGGKTSTTYEAVDGTPATVGSGTIDSSKQGSFVLDTDNRNSMFGPSASLRLNFHF
jgi:hypothetical protein